MEKPGQSAGRRILKAQEGAVRHVIIPSGLHQGKRRCGGTASLEIGSWARNQDHLQATTSVFQFNGTSVLGLYRSGRWSDSARVRGLNAAVERLHAAEDVPELRRGRRIGGAVLQGRNLGGDVR